MPYPSELEGWSHAEKLTGRSGVQLSGLCSTAGPITPRPLNQPRSRGNEQGVEIAARWTWHADHVSARAVTDALVLDAVGGAEPPLTTLVEPNTDPAGFQRINTTGRTHARTPVVIIVKDRHITIANKTTGEIITDFTLNTTRNYQGQQKRP